MKKNFFYKFFIIIFFINILGLGILLTLDRMPYLIFFFSTFILLIILKNYRIHLFASLILTIFLFLVFFNNYKIVKNRYLSLAGDLEIVKITKLFQKNISVKSISPKNIIKEDDNFKGDYLKIYNASLYIFLENPFLGTGLKSFLYECKKLQNNNKKSFTCSTHPHNIYLEILVNQGILGLLLLLLFIVILINNNYSKVIFSQTTIEKKILSIFFFSILISELIPIRSYGSIFQTVNGSIFWFLLSIISSKIHLPKK